MPEYKKSEIYKRWDVLWIMIMVSYSLALLSVGVPFVPASEKVSGAI